MNQGGNRNPIYPHPSPFVSIITVVYNSETLLERTIKSVKGQVNKDYEFIIVDGGSKDRTLEIIKQYEKDINYWVSEKDEGIYDAMNKGLQIARGKYIWFINSGDEINSPSTLEEIKRLGKAADIYFGETNCVNSAGVLLGTRSEMSTRKLPLKLSFESMKYGMVVSHQSILIKKSITSLYNTQYKCSADIDWVLQALKKSTQVVHCKQVLSKYLVGGYSINNLKECWKERFTIYRKHYGLLQTLLSHVVIAFRTAGYKIVKPKSNQV